MRSRTSLLRPSHVARLTGAARALRSREGAYVAGAAAIVPVLLVAFAAFWVSPLSPVALDRPAARVAQGDIAGAAAEYDALAHSRAPADVRHEAAWRAAQLSSLDAQHAADGVAQLEAYLAEWGDTAHAPDALALMAGLVASDLSDPARAASCWEQAARLDPRHPDAGRWLLEAGKARARTGQVASAEQALALATNYPAQSGSAWLALARMRLSSDPAAAYDAYDSAFRAVPAHSAGAALARLGMATALERLEGREAALAQLDEALAEGDLLDRSLLRRRQRLRGDL